MKFDEMYVIEYPKYFGTRLINRLKRYGISAYDLIFNIKSASSIMTKYRSGIGITSLWKITQFRDEFFTEHKELVDIYWGV